MHFNWDIYSFSTGHFASSIESWQLPFTISFACNTAEQWYSLFHEFVANAQVFSLGSNLLNHICTSGDQSIITGLLFPNKWVLFIVLETTVIYYCTETPTTIIVGCGGNHFSRSQWPHHKFVCQRAWRCTLECNIKGSFIPHGLFFLSRTLDSMQKMSRILCHHNTHTITHSPSQAQYQCPSHPLHRIQCQYLFFDPLYTA